MYALQLPLRTLAVRHITRGVLEGINSPERTTSSYTSQRVFSTVLPLEDSPSNILGSLTQSQAHSPTKSAGDAVFEEESEEYRSNPDMALPFMATTSSTSTTGKFASPSSNTLDGTKAPLSISSATSTFRGSSDSYFIPSAVGLHQDNISVTDAGHAPESAHEVDPTVFEALSEEYLETDEVAVETVQRTPLPSTSTRITPIHKAWQSSHRTMHRSTGLREMVENGDYARAEALRAQLFEADIQIKRHTIYAEAALHAWKTKPVQERTDRFYEWFSLMPSASLGRIRRGRKSIQNVRLHLFKEPSDLNTIACFGLVAARKGFGNFIALDVAAHIARFASPGVSTAYFDHLERSATNFYGRFGKHTSEISDFSRWNGEKWHNVFIRALCFAGYMEACVDRLSHILQSNRAITISPFTWAVLLENLIQLQRGDLVTVVRNLHTTTTPKATSPLDKSERPDPPSAHYLADQMSAYIESGRFEDLADLRNEMLIAGARSDLWATAQIKFYMDRQQYIIVLRQFAHFYSFVGVPKDALLPYIQADLPDIYGKYAVIHPSLPIVSPPTHSRGINRWPSTHALTMVWQALVCLVRDLGTLQNLYRSFITYLDEHRPSTPSGSQAVDAEDYNSRIRFQYPPAMSPDTVHFHVFIMAFARIAGGDAAIQVISDMQARGIQPDVHNWTALAGHYAGQNDVDRAERILNRMESTLADKQTAPARSSEVHLENRTREGAIRRKAGWIPEPSLVTYTTILRGLIDRGNFQDAKRIALRMDEAGYVPGTDEQTDKVLQLLRNRERAPRVPWETRP